MKRVEAIIPSERLLSVNEALKKTNATGVTCFDTKGRGQVPIRSFRGSRGTSVYTPEFNSNCSIYVVVRDSDAEQVVQAIVNAGGSGMAGEGKIFITGINEVVDIATKQRGDAAL
jgi:nitrogen regulatory protein P-II 1